MQLEPELTVDLTDTMLMQQLQISHPCRVLLVDDDDLVRARLANLLRASQFEVDVAASGNEALRIMNQRPCQVLLTDWQMPDMDGLSLCRVVRADQHESYVYVLMLTVRDNKNDLAETASYLGIPVGLVEAAVNYYGEYRDEIDEQIADNEAEYERGYAAWEAGQRALAS